MCAGLWHCWVMVSGGRSKLFVCAHSRYTCLSNNRSHAFCWKIGGPYFRRYWRASAQPRPRVRQTGCRCSIRRPARLDDERRSASSHARRCRRPRCRRDPGEGAARMSRRARQGGARHEQARPEAKPQHGGLGASGMRAPSASRSDMLRDAESASLACTVLHPSPRRLLWPRLPTRRVRDRHVTGT